MAIEHGRLLRTAAAHDMMGSIASSPAVDVAASGNARRARYWPLLVLALMLPIWSIGIFDRGMWTPDEPREYDIAYNMLQTGDLITPRLAGEPFLEKPPLSYWAQSASMSLLKPSIATARLPNLLWAALTALCIGMLAGDMVGEEDRHRAALIAALATGTTYLALLVQIWLATDAPLLAMTAVALLSTWRLAHAKSALQELRWSLLLGSFMNVFRQRLGNGWLQRLRDRRRYGSCRNHWFSGRHRFGGG
jgi:4-amino-4-deoxy-L-arabinose transferase-like glycosyltransferase